MNKSRIWGLLAALCLLGFPPLVFCDNAMTLGDFGVVERGGEVSLPLTLASTDDVQGLVATFDWDGAKGVGAELELAAVLGPTEADTVVTRVTGTYMVLGVVMDNDGVGVDQVIPANSNPLLATAKITVPVAAPLGLADVTFRDGLYASVEGGPVLDNIVVVGGLSIGQEGDPPGLVLDGGSYEVVDCISRFYIDSAAATSDTGKARVLMDSCANVEGYVVALQHDSSKVTLTGIDEGDAATDAAADFIAVELFATGGTIGVVVDLTEPYVTEPWIPTGDALEIAVFSYSCVSLPAAGDPPVVSDLTFEDNVFGTPAKENVIVVGGLSVGKNEGLILVDGTFTCKPPEKELVCDDGIDNDSDGDTDCDDSDCVGKPGCVVVREDCTNGVDDDGDGKVDCCDSECAGTVACREDCSNDEDDDCDGLVDGDDPDCQRGFACGGLELDPDTGLPVPVTEGMGGETDICFYLLNPEDEVLGAHDMDHIQGFSMSAEFCCSIEPVAVPPATVPEFDISGTILEALGAEYVRLDVDTDPDDGDGCQLIIGVLVDALPPFDGRTITSSEDYQKMGCVRFRVKTKVEDPDVLCGPCDITFEDGLNGSGKVPINNLISVENYSYPMLATAVNCSIVITGETKFFRGDCNYSGDSGGPAEGAYAVDISDAAAMVSFLFLPGMYKFDPPCLDACDCNDDGRIDLADVVCVLRYLFQQGKFPPAPGPGWRENGLENPGNVEPTGSGSDPTEDMLGCDAINPCV
jgi:hypothetical protein